MLLFISEGSVLDFCFSVDMFSYICMANVMRKEMDLERIYLERLRKGSYKDFTKLYELYVSRLYAFALGLTHSDVLAKDIVQETFIKVWIRREQIDPDMSFRSFLFTMAKNQLLNEFRRQANSPLFLEDIAFVESRECDETAIERKLSLEEFNHKLEVAKQKLSPRQRELFELSKEQGLSITEIAVKTLITEQSVRNQISQALHILRKELGNYAFLFSLFFIG
ncbi:RNA polymerase sigma factor [Parabacteroides sp.]|uniref:RNA polymerase sigma factor n=1 Tax=Parabacteroides sp. TaxID=1869337 RepID=UPI0026DF7A3E|nr:RNA polymerase sigma-70 factor [Parabacteroides sp.]MDO5429110.1 RNA polymerase sigma-70 factor [Parabacteroides sp.]